MAELDQIDRRILHELSRDARQTNLKLAERVGLSPSACLRRVQELERSGVITGYRAVIDRSRLGAGFVAYVTVGLSNHTKDSLRAFEKAISACPDVVEFHTVTGTIEYLLRVELADMKAYKTFHNDVLGTQPHVSSITSYIVMDTPKNDRA
ncbi:Lrp/AsnC family leucine-responsive transcriptional regulator [Pseudomonas frederiksbergensis]|jgi:DNA-binding Lrp family transcriptional regulator|uniref:Lrp/AsnC family transcriptional regulator n=1 Tax=Pseudomonas TaxID=286 RepID=UPI00110DAE31|nr:MULTISPECIES: Lrp/AsnC family transcriptional regulator [unclassified Pseudomonas]MBD9616530.1 Lrp/AsnC family transcriptional regulator [Pseudomonas sp. PDM07]QDV96471.1 Lrp/AsnC family transcriptional regulator [Pseudomonas sp. ATCC 43928]